MIKSCLIGGALSHSYSAEIHRNFGYSYELVPLKEEELFAFVKNGGYDAFNVTIPFKEKIIGYLDGLSYAAKEIGAVNTVVSRGGKMWGYNTDIDGFAFMMEADGVSVKDKKVLVLGSGGASKAVIYYLKKAGAKTTVVSRSGENNYNNLYKNYDSEIIINTTPVGMYPNLGERLIDLNEFKKLEYVVDLIYNPLMTDLMFQAKKNKIKYRGGLLMLVAQAVYAKALFLDEKINTSVIFSEYFKLLKKIKNIVLIGMPSAGKTTVGKKLAELLNKPFVDTDEQIELSEKMSVPEIFKKYGEEYFRKKELEKVLSLGGENGRIIALGGGAILTSGAYEAVKQNGTLFYLTRDIAKADFTNRPLSANREAYLSLFNKRAPVYLAASDYTVENDGEAEATALKIMEILNENSCN